MLDRNPADYETVCVLDTETTGMLDFKMDTHHFQQPHIVQLAYKIYHKGDCVISNSYLVQSEFDSHPKALEVHGKTMALRNKFGISYAAAMANFRQDMKQCDLLVAHNMNFDSRILQRALLHCFDDQELVLDFLGKPSYCTMQSTTAMLAIQGPRGNKWPKLDEAYCRMVDRNGFAGAHDAMVDVQACAAIFFAIINETWQEKLTAFNTTPGLGAIANV